MRLMVALSFLMADSPACAAQSIVGTWANTKAECKTDPVVITPMGIESDYTICYFNNVKRSGNKVTWGGHCFVDSSRRPEEGEDGEVDAVVKNGKISIDGLGFGMSDLMRCK